MAFFALGTTQLAVALGSRVRPGTLANPMLLAAVAGALALQFAGLYLPFLQELLHTKPLTGLDLLVVFLLSALGDAAVRLTASCSAASARPAESRAKRHVGQDSEP